VTLVEGRSTTVAFKSFWAFAFLKLNIELNEIAANQQISRIFIFIVLKFLNSFKFNHSEKVFVSLLIVGKNDFI